MVDQRRYFEGHSYESSIDLGQPEELRAHLLETVKSQRDDGMIFLTAESSPISGNIHYNIKTGEVEFVEPKEFHNNVTISYNFPWLIHPVQDAISAFVKVELMNELIKLLANSGSEGDAALCKRMCDRHCAPGSLECTRNLTLGELDITLHSIRGVKPSLVARMGIFGGAIRKPDDTGIQKTIANALNGVGIEKIDSRNVKDDVLSIVNANLNPEPADIMPRARTGSN